MGSVPFFSVFSLLIAVTAGAATPERFDGPDLGAAKEANASFRPGDSARASVVVFLSARCPCSASHERRLKELASEFSPRGIRFVGVHSNSDEDVALARTHFRESALPFPIIQDERARYADALGALKTPHVFVLDPRGAVLFQGGVDDSHVAAGAKRQYLAEALDAVAAGREPPRKEVRALGCIIQRP